LLPRRLIRIFTFAFSIRVKKPSFHIFRKDNYTLTTQMKTMIFRNWHFMRFVRLALGLAVIVQSVRTGDWTMGLIGLIFTAMPVFNIGCCGMAGCATPAKKKYSDTKKDISYEEVV
jgi:hypothetical protein